MTEGFILHLLPEPVWNAMGPGDAYEPASLAIEGFVHCTGDDELLLRVANAFYTSETGPMVAVSIDPSRLHSEVRWEHPSSADPLAAERFPHVYGPLEVDAVTAVRRLRRLSDGTYAGFEAAND